MKHRAITLAFAACFASSLALAGDAWTLDSSTSNARFVQGSKANPGSVNTGVARVTGKVRLDADYLGTSVFDLAIYPADEYWRHALSAGGALPAGYHPDATDHTLLTFKSKRIVRTGTGKLEAIGDLTLTRVERSVATTPTEAYAGPVYGDPFLHTYSREATFLFPGLNAARFSGPLTPAALRNTQALEISGSTVVGDEEFPELLSAIKDTNWAPVVQNKDCHMPSIGDDYSGALCTGRLIAATRDDNCPMPASVGEDYRGSLCAPAASNRTTIVLDLNLLRAAPESSMGMLSEKSIRANR